MKKSPYLLVIWILCLIFCSSCKKETDIPEIDSIDNHPRLLLLKGEEAQIRALIEADPVWEKMHYAILKACNKILGKPLLERKMTGRRLLSVSRECLRRVYFLSYGYRMTEDERFLKRAEEEMLKVAGFRDWNPSHFLDVAEMTMGLAIGYDWLYAQLSESSRVAIRQAIKTKGLEPSFNSKYNSFVRSTNNWNPVCHAGMSFGALAVEGAYSTLARQTLDRAIENVPRAMAQYQPDGAYPEGYAYWGYGTTTNVMLLHALEKAHGTDYGLSDSPGFLQTARYLEHMLGATNLCYNWGDCSLGGSLKSAMFWFAQKTNDPSLLWMEKKFLERDDFSYFTGDRLLPSIMIWAKDIPLENITEPTSKVYIGQGASPVCLMRTSWSDPNAVYLGFKAGSPSTTHGHMDIGSFIMEADGVRWASDFGKQNYESLESKGMKIFGRTQDAQRWTIFRYNNLAHNTLTIDGQHQRVEGYAKIDHHSEQADFSFAISDISAVYHGQLKKARRGVGIIDEKYVVIQDEVNPLGQPTTLRWTMMTHANVSLGQHEASLTKDGKTLYLKVEGPDRLQMKTWSTAPTNDYDAPNPGTTLMGFECELMADTPENFRVFLIPEKSMADFVGFDKALEDW